MSDLRVSLLTTLGGNIGLHADAIVVLTRHLQTFGKVFRRLEELSAARLVRYPGSEELVLHYWGKVMESADAPPEFTNGGLCGIHGTRV